MLKSGWTFSRSHAFLVAPLLAGVAVCVPGCSALAHAVGMNEETDATYLAPPADLGSAPQETGLLLVDASIATCELDGICLDRLVDHATFRVAGFADPDLRGTVLFAGLEPGDYRVTGFRVRNAGETDFVRASYVPMYVVKVVANQATYLGRFEASAENGQFVVSQMLRSGREAALWAALGRKYAGSPWVSRFTAGSSSAAPTATR